MHIMKKVLSLLMIACANFVAMAQSDYVSEMKAKAEAGDAKEMYFLGQSYEYGHNGLEKDEATAVSWFKKSAESGYISAATKLASAYQRGKLGLPKDDSQYVYWV